MTFQPLGQNCIACLLTKGLSTAAIIVIVVVVIIVVIVYYAI